MMNIEHMTNIHICACVGGETAKLTSLDVNTNVGTADIERHTRIMELLESISVELVEGLQEIIDDTDASEPFDPSEPLEPVDIPVDNPFDPHNPIPVPTPVPPIVSDR